MSDESIWKKEITFRRKPKAAAPAAPPEVVPAQPAKAETSIWKKEISFSRKRAAEVPVFPEPVPPQPVQVPIVEPQPVPVPQPQPVMAVPPPAPVQPVVAPPPPVQAPSFEPQPVPPLQAPAVPTSAQPLVEVPQPQPAPAPEPWSAVVAPEPAPAQPAEAPRFEPAPVPEPHPAAPEPMPVAQDVEPEPEPAPWPTVVEAAQPAPLPVEPVQAPQYVPVQAPAPWPATSVPESEPAYAPAPPPAVAVPVPAAPAPVAEPVQFETSMWKKEISFRRKPKKQAEAKPAPTAVTEIKLPQAREHVPLLKRGPSLSLPTPSFRRSSGGHKAKRVVGLKIGASQVSAAHVANNGAAELLKLAREPLEQGVVVAGELRDPEALAEALKRFFARNKLPRKNVRLGIASNRIGVRIFDLAGIDDEKQLANAIRFRAQETLPIPLDEAVLDYRVLSEQVDDAGNASRRVLLVVAYRELVDRYVAACKKAGITLSGIDLEAFALLRSLAPPLPEQQQPESALVAVSIGHERSTFAVSDGRVCEFTRVLDWGGSALSLGLARALDLTPSGVESIKRELSLDPSEPPQGMHPQHHAIAIDALRRQVQSFARELVSSLQFYQHQPGSLPIGEIVITGGTAHLGGFAGELQRLTGVRVRVGDPLARMKVAKRVQLQEPIGSLSVAIGLGIED
jgi:type IV pilus assembly protein PilM